MATTQPAQHDPNSSHTQQASPTQPSPTGQQATASQEQSNMPVVGLAQDQVIALLKTLPNMYRVQGDPKDAAETLSSMSQSANAYAHMPSGVQLYQHYTSMEASSSAHRAPPPLTQIAPAPPPGVRTPTSDGDMHAGSQSPHGGHLNGSQSGSPDGEKPKGTPGRRNGRSATMTNEEWARQRKDNHKEVERRRRGNINEGINELGRIVPNGSGEKAKGAILARAVQYIHHLKENEARNIEKWTLEKLLMDQAMGDLQQQLEEMKRLWEEERGRRERVETELEVLKGLRPHGQVPAQQQGTGVVRPESSEETHGPSPKRTADDVEGQDGVDADGNKRQRVD